MASLGHLQFSAPSRQLFELPTCPASELSETTSFTEVNTSKHAHIWYEAMAHEFRGLCDAETFVEW